MSDTSSQLTLQMAQESMIKCQQSISLLEAQYKSNQEIVAYNNAKVLECAAQDQRNLDNYNNQCNDKRRKHDDWERCIRDRENAHLAWRDETGCVVWERAKNGWDCGAGNEGDGAYGGGCAAGWGKSRCKHSGDYARDHARRECGPEPSTECGQKPPAVPCPLKQQDATQVAVNCCANVTSIVGSEVQQSTIQQQTACLNEKKQAILGPSQKQTSSSKTQNQQASSQTASSDGGITLIIIIIVIVIICIIGFIYYNYYYKSSYYNPRLPYYPPPPRPYYPPPRPAPIMLPPPPRPYYVPPPPSPPAPVQFAPPPPPVPVQMAPAPVSTQLPPGKYMTIGQGKVMKIG